MYDERCDAVSFLSGFFGAGGGLKAILTSGPLGELMETTRYTHRGAPHTARYTSDGAVYASPRHGTMCVCVLVHVCLSVYACKCVSMYALRGPRL